MAVIKRMSSKATVSKIEKYLKQEEKTEEKLISGLNCDSQNFAKECQATNLLYDKNKSEGERKYYHIVQSFSPKDNVNLSPKDAHDIAMKFAERNFNGHEVLVVTHKDKDHIHNHFVVNSVSLENGKKYRADNKSLWQMRRDSNELCREKGLSHSIQPLDKRASNKIKSGEIRKALRGDEVWKLELKAQIETVSKKANSFEQFKQEMAAKYKVEVRERTRKSKGKVETIYEYKPKENRKFCPERRLGTDYGKEYLDGVIRQNATKARGTNTRDAGAGAGAGTRNGVDTRNLESEIRDRQIESIKLDLEQRKQESVRSEKEHGRDKGKEPKTTKRSKPSSERER